MTSPLPALELDCSVVDDDLRDATMGFHEIKAREYALPLNDDVSVFSSMQSSLKTDISAA